MTLDNDSADRLASALIGFVQTIDANNAGYPAMGMSLVMTRFTEMGHDLTAALHANTHEMAEHRAALMAHSRIMSEHITQLAQHGSALSEHGGNMASHSYALMNSGR